MGIFEQMSKSKIKRIVVYPARTAPAAASGIGIRWIQQTLKEEGHEKIVLISDPAVKLRAAIGIHDRTLCRQSMGGCRVLPYRNERAMIRDVLNLSRAMTYKAAMADLKRGGGKAVIWCDPRTEKTPRLLLRLAEEVDRLRGEYIICEDMNFTPADILVMREKTVHVAGLPLRYHQRAYRGSGDPSPVTAQGILLGMKACLRFQELGPLRGKTVAIQGLGKVGYALARLLLQEGARLIACDVNAERCTQLLQEYSERGGRSSGAVKIVSPEDIFRQKCDIFAPCAGGGALNPKTIPVLRCGIVAGGANNQLADAQCGKMLLQRGILYAPDYVINAGGLINLDEEKHPEGYSARRARKKLEVIYFNLLRIFWFSSRFRVPPGEVADLLVDEKIHFAKKENQRIW